MRKSYDPLHYDGKDPVSDEQRIRERDAPDLASTPDLWAHTKVVGVPNGIWTSTAWTRGARQRIWVSMCFPLEQRMPLPTTYETVNGKMRKRVGGSRVDRRFWHPIDALRNLVPTGETCPLCPAEDNHNSKHGGPVAPGFVFEEAADFLLHRGKIRPNRAKWMVVEVWEDRLRLLPLRGWPWYLEDPLSVVLRSAPMTPEALERARAMAAPIREVLERLSPKEQVAVLEALKPPRPLA